MRAPKPITLLLLALCSAASATTQKFSDSNSHFRQYQHTFSATTTVANNVHFIDPKAVPARVQLQTAHPQAGLNAWNLRLNSKERCSYCRNGTSDLSGVSDPTSVSITAGGNLHFAGSGLTVGAGQGWAPQAGSVSWDGTLNNFGAVVMGSGRGAVFNSYSSGQSVGRPARHD